jgi:RimK family alpha-L-glutamate ligase
MRVGVFGSPDSWYVRELCCTGEQRGVQMLPLDFTQLASYVDQAGVKYFAGETDLTTLDAILVRTMPPGTLEQVVLRMDLLSGLQQAGVRIVNPPRAIECAVDKYLTTQRLALAGLPVPPTLTCETADAALDAFEQLGRDVVVKPLFGAEGRGIIRVSDPDLAFRAFRTIERLGAVIYMQQFVRGPGFDIRVLLLDGTLLASMKRTPKLGDFRANISQQGTASLHSVTDTELQLARSAAEVTGCLFAGVDIMYDEQDRPLLIEVNAVPGWKGLQAVTGIDVPAKVFDWLESTMKTKVPRRAP